MSENNQTVVGRTTYEMDGAGPFLILIHGVGLDRHMWRPLLPFLRSRFTVVTYDLLGHGESGTLPEHSTVADFAGQFDELMSQLGVVHCFVVGFSLGGLVVQRILLDYPTKIAAAAVLNSVFARSETERAAVLDRLKSVEREGIGVSIDAAIERWFDPAWLVANPSAEEEIRTRLASNILAEYTKAYRIFATADAELETRVACIDRPVLVVSSDNDINSTPQMAYALAERISGAEALILSGLKHMGLWQHPAAYGEALCDFWTRRSGSNGDRRNKGSAIAR